VRAADSTTLKARPDTYFKDADLCVLSSCALSKGVRGLSPRRAALKPPVPADDLLADALKEDLRLTGSDAVLVALNDGARDRDMVDCWTFRHRG
jgi:hypothetical protein